MSAAINLKKLMDAETDADLNKKSDGELRDLLGVSDDQSQLEFMNQKFIDMLTKRLTDRQLVFYAFLNKEFNQLNYKSAKCSKTCFDDLDWSLKEVNTCLNVCREGINSCHSFANRLQS